MKEEEHAFGDGQLLLQPGRRSEPSVRHFFHVTNPNEIDFDLQKKKSIIFFAFRSKATYNIVQFYHITSAMGC
jgi:hypothetical protein